MMDQSQLYCGHCGIPECHAKNAAECREWDRDRERRLREAKRDRLRDQFSKLESELMQLERGADIECPQCVFVHDPEHAEFVVNIGKYSVHVERNDAGKIEVSLGNMITKDYTTYILDEQHPDLKEG